MFDLVTLPRLRRWASNWARLIILLPSPRILLPKDRSVFRRSLIFQPRPSLRSTASVDLAVWTSTARWVTQVKALHPPTLGCAILFGIPPGFSSSPSCGFLPSWILAFLLDFPSGSGAAACCLLAAVLFDCCSAMVLGPMTGTEGQKAEERAGQPAYHCRLADLRWRLLDALESDTGETFWFGPLVKESN